MSSHLRDLAVKGYGCVKCQMQHFDFDNEYKPHVDFQSKHGIELFNPYTVALVLDERRERGR